MVQSQDFHRPPLRSVREAYANIATATYTAKAGDRLIGVDRAGAVTITLPTAEVRKGRVYTVKDESGAAATNNITVATEGAETIDGSATDVINVNYESKSYYSDGSNWYILPVSPDTNTQNSYEAPGLTLGTSNVEGTGNSIRSGATVLAFDATVPSTQAHGDAAAVGSAAVAARRDHKHAMPAGSGSDQSVHVSMSSGQSINNATDTILLFDTEQFDTNALHSTSSNTGRLTVPAGEGGVYVIVAQLDWAGDADGFRQSNIKLNGVTVLSRWNRNVNGDAGGFRYSQSSIETLSAGDYVEIEVHHTAGAALSVNAGASNTLFMMAKVLG